MSGDTVESVAQYRERFRREVVPRHYSPILHVAFNLTVLLGLCVFCWAQLESPSWQEWLTLPLMMIAGNVTVFAIHKFALHRRLPLIGKHAYDIHSKQHHRFYTAEAIVYDSPRDFYILFFPWWTVAGFALTFLPAAYFGLSPFASANVVWLVMFSGTLYFLLYETVHFASHLPDEHPLLVIPPLRFMREHHRVHHDPVLMHRYNFNIVWPLCDYVFGTVHEGERSRTRARA